MKSILETQKQNIIAYCEENNISSEKLFSSPKCHRDDLAFILLSGPDEPEGLRKDDERMEVLLKIEYVNNRLLFTPGENMKKYLT